MNDSSHEQPVEPDLDQADSAAVPPEISDWDDCPLEVELDYDARVNFAMQQNDVPVVKRLRILNTGEGEVAELILGLQIAGHFSEKKQIRVDRLAPGGEFLLERLDLDLDPRALSSRTEREKTRIEITVESEGRKKDLHYPIEILAYNEWGGLASLPEITAAFIQPNHPAIDGILATAQRIHGQRNGTTALSAYQSESPERAVAEIRSIYEALAALEISYVGVPASFENSGQKVRLVDAILEHRLGNCLDLSLLFASALEQAGFNPLVVLVKGHAFVGAWTGELSYPEPAIDDAARLRKRADLGDLILLEATMITNRPPASFEQARAEGRRRLDADQDFEFAVDVACARRLKIRPLPARVDRLRREDENGATITIRPDELPGFETTTSIRVDDLDFPATPTETGEAPAEVTTTTPGVTPAKTRQPRRETRIDRWKRRLLDLSLRNRLLNFRATKKTLSLHVPDPARLEDRLAEGGEFAILSRAALADDASPRNLQAMSERTQEDALRAFHLDEMAAGRLHAPFENSDLERRLVELHRAARGDLEETGANTLHLALGFLSWFETESSSQERRAPLIMLPVELVRRSARAEFRLRLADDEARINVTLLEKLRRDHAIEVQGLDELPTDDTGLDIGTIFRRFREAIVDMPRWDIVEDAALGLFSFNKFLMWQDLEQHAATLKESPVVRHLIDEPGASFEPNAEYHEAGDLDHLLAAADNFCPLDADSSQLAAVLAATSGRTFVLQGPPGTGKSQTITNLIAQALARGQRVLFVAEKMAALNVVHSRLARVGLESACLEIHSNKSSKRHVLDQLRRAIETTATAAPAEWDRTAADLERHRADLNAYVAAIHERHMPGLSVYEATSRLIGMKETPRIEIGIANPEDVDETSWRGLRELAQSLGVAAAELGQPGEHPLAGMRLGDWTPRLAHEIEEALDACEVARLEWRESLADTETLLGLEGEEIDGLDRVRIQALTTIAGLLLAGPGVEKSLITEPGFAELATRLHGAIDRGRARDELRAELSRRYDDALLDGDPAPYAQALRRARASFPPLSFIRGFFARRALLPHAKGALPDADTLIVDLDRVQKLRDENAALAAAGTDENHFFGRHWRAGRGDWKALAGILDWAGKFRAALLEFTDLRGPHLRDRLLALATTERDLIVEGGARRRPLERIRLAGAKLEERIAGFIAVARFALDERIEDRRPGFGEALGALIAGIQSGLRDLRPWCHWARQRHEASQTGLAGLVRAIEKGRCAPERSQEVFERSFLEDWLEHRLEASDLLLQFNSREHERLIASFRALDRKQMELARGVLSARIAARAPALDRQVSARSEVGILQRQLKLKRRHLPIRKLFESLPELLPRLKPCLLMSPLSVAQYLGADFPRADLVIFDEASQIPVWDAIGALARGRAAVVVGDSRQLPPTSFFARAADDEDEGRDEEMVEELESILDECEASGLHSLRLLWHYRSRHEGLIAFSNHHYYDGRLQTFPAPQGATGARGVRFELVPDAVYDRSGNATNEAEARAITADLVRRLLSLSESKSIGVVAFSKAQQDLILDLVEAERRKHPEIESSFVEDAAESVFIKNLENVQGDERDVILFSICYGPDAQGRVSMNFGPLNREGGERRLNVAVTRARRELIVFASLRPEQIDLARSQAIGVAHLKSFLEYAERGPRALGDQAALSADRGRGRGFENALADELEARGFEVDREVGCSSFKIDVAVRDPRDPARHLLGIECDGACYRDAASARDRDRIREGVLGSLGWTLMRVWSQDWYQDSERELARVIERLDGLLAQPLPVAEIEKVAAEVTAEPAVEGDGAGVVQVEEAVATENPEIPTADAALVDTPVEIDPPVDVVENGEEGEALALPVADEALPMPGEEEMEADTSTDATTDEVDEPTEAVQSETETNPRHQAVVPTDQTAADDYVETPLKERAIGLDDARGRKAIDDMIQALTEGEWPIHQESVMRRVARAAGVGRLTPRIKGLIEARIAALESVGRINRDAEYLLPADRTPESLTRYRRNPAEGPARSVEEIHPAEIALAVADVLASQIALPGDELLREVSRSLGYARTSPRMLRFLQAGVEHLAERGDCVIDEVNVRLPRAGDRA